MTNSSNTPTYNLQTIKNACASTATLSMTGSARRGASALGMEDQDVVDAIQSLNPNDFHKTMPSIKMPTAANQDVYKFDWRGTKIYAKFQDLGGLLVVSFKEK